MKFACDQCHKRFSTADEPVPGRVYRVPCRCGNTIVVQLQAAEMPLAHPANVEPAARRGAPPPLPTRAAPDAPLEFSRPPAVAAALGARDAAMDDPFAPAEPALRDLRALLASSSDEVTPTILARRDPDAPRESSSMYDPEEPRDPLGEELRRTRTQALALGSVAGATGGVFCAAAITLALMRPWSPAVAETAAPPADVAVVQLASTRGPERPVAARKAPARAVGPSLAVAAPAAVEPLAAAAPTEPAARRRKAVAPVAPAALDAARGAPERAEATAEAATEPVRLDTSEARDERAAPAERPEASAEEAPAAAPPAEAPPVRDEPEPAPAVAAGAQGDPPPARDP